MDEAGKEIIIFVIIKGGHFGRPPTSQTKEGDFAAK
jgi:hypothetical protein